jgi:hypothetical protein
MTILAQTGAGHEVGSAGERAFDWVVKNRARFLPSSSGEEIDVRQTKPLIELAIMLHVHERFGCSNALVRVLDPVELSNRFRSRQIRSRTDIVVHAFVYAILRHAGHDDRDQREMIQSAIDARLLDHVERTPHQMMEERLALDLGAFTHSLPRWQDLVDLSILGNTPNALHLNEIAAYHVSHVILFLFGFGTLRELQAQLGPRPDLRRLLSDLIIAFCAKRQWDLLGELLLCWDCLELEPSSVYDRALCAFLSQQAPDGSFAGPEPRSKGSDEASRRGEPDARDQFLVRYHTTLVAVMACDRKGHRLKTVGCKAVAAAPVSSRARVRHQKVNNQRLLSSAEKDAQWLSRLFSRLSVSNDLRPNTACSVLVGTWMCAAINRDVLPLLPNLARDVGAKILPVPIKDWLDVPPTLSILTNALLAEFGVAVPGLSAFVRAACSALDAQVAVDAVSDLAFCEKRVLFGQFGQLKPPMLLHPHDVVQAASTVPLDGSRAAVETLVLQLGSATGYGTHSPELGVDKDPIGELVAGLAVRFFRAYDIVTAAKLVRSGVYLRCENDALADQIEFIMLQHRPEGGYGYFAAQETAVRQSVGSAFSADRDLYLPVTLSCLWTLAEATTEWRLYRWSEPTLGRTCQ